VGQQEVSRIGGEAFSLDVLELVDEVEKKRKEKKRKKKGFRNDGVGEGEMEPGYVGQVILR